MSVESGQAIAVDFTTADPTTGAAVDADSTPTGTVVVNGVDDAASVTVTNKATGIYRASATLPGLSAGDRVQMRIAATVGGVAGVGYVWGDWCEVLQSADAADRLPASLVSGRIDASVGAVAADAITAAAIAADAIGASELAATAASEIGAAVWAAVERTLTSSGALSQDDIDAIVAAITALPTESVPPPPGTLTMRRGDTATLTVTGLGAIAADDTLWLTAKFDESTADAAATFEVERTAGLLILNGAAPDDPIDESYAALTVDDAVAGDITCTIRWEATTLIAPRTIIWAVKRKTAAGAAQTMRVGSLVIRPAIRAAGS